MKQQLVRVTCTLLLITLFTMVRANPSPKLDATSLEGRWDLTVTMSGKERPSWLEVQHSGIDKLVGRFVFVDGSARPISKITFANGKFSFTIPPQWEKSDVDIHFEGTISDNGLSGTMAYVDGKTYNWTGVRAPLLRRTAEPVWGEPIALLNGKDLSGWHAMGENQWQMVNGVLSSDRKGSNLVTDQKFNDFKLHIEFRFQKESNSGVYLRGRYEVQVMDSKGMEPAVGLFSAVYGFLTPTEITAKDPGEWQTYDITLIGRMVTIEANGKTVICNQAIPGITGGALDSKEGEPGPLLLQGDHGAIDYRNIIITPAK